ncbi:MAG: hypothetical protein ABIH41_03045 [Nanoarchaeota archaeon]
MRRWMLIAIIVVAVAVLFPKRIGEDTSAGMCLAGVCASERSRSCLGVKAGMITCLDCFHPIVCYGIPYGSERCTTQVGD